ncbi:MAG: PEGA domain-containing protein [Desulfocapsaceae bacterium]|nr:PEGA domain-containing protein [Desulfocapsaceae bacterium]
MAAHPSIVIGASTGYVQDQNTMILMCLYENKASLGYTSGMAKFLGSEHDKAVNMCWQDPADAALICVNTTAYNLKGKARIVVAGRGNFNYGCLESFGCSAGDDCANHTCATWGTRISFETDITTRPYNNITPPAPTGLTVTPGNGALTLQWNTVDDPTGGEVFAYYIAILDAGTPVSTGHVEAGLRNVTIGGLTNGKSYSIEVKAVSHNNFASAAATKSGTPVGATNPVVYNILTIPDSPVAGALFTIKAQIANTGPDGKVRAVFRVNGTQISDQNSTLNTFPGGSLWDPVITYTMPATATTITVDAYGWDGTNWTSAPTGTMSITRTPGAVPCTSVTLTPFAINLNAGDKATFTAAVTPATTAFDVQFKDRAGTLLGSCKTSGGSCTYIWDSAGKPAGTYYVTASVAQGSCTSTESTIQLSAPTRQWNVNVYVKDSITNNPIYGATVTIGTQSKQTDANGYVQFRVDEGTITILISSTGYNNFTTVESIFSDKTFNYVLSPTGISKGTIQFISVPSGAEVFVDDMDQSVKTPVTVTNITAGDHTFTLKLTGYNDTVGNITVVGGSTVQVYAVLSPITPTTGSLNITSVPAGAEIIIDGQDQSQVTPRTITNITPGSHAVKLTKTGYADFTAQVNVTAGTTTYLSVTLTIIPGIGTIEISSIPSGARVFIDGQDQSLITPATITSIPEGSHAYKLTLAGYNDATGNFIITSGQTTTVSATLVPATGLKWKCSGSPGYTCGQTADGIFNSQAECQGACKAASNTGTILVGTILGLGAIGAIVYSSSKNEKQLPYNLPRSSKK